MIAIFSASYNVALTENSDTRLPHAEARIIRAATLDSDPGVVMIHRGTFHGDRTFKIRGSVTRDQEADLRAMHEAGAVAYCAIPEGTFQGFIHKMEVRYGVLDLEFYVKEKSE